MQAQNSPEDEEEYDDSGMTLERYQEIERQKRSRPKVCLACFQVFTEETDDQVLGRLYCPDHVLSIEGVISDE